MTDSRINQRWEGRVRSRLVTALILAFLPVLSADALAQTINKSVGKEGKNDCADVRVVQFLLNQVPPDQGGPDPKLFPDGKSGPKTEAAILRFQMANTNVADGRVDPEGQTIKKLREFNQQGDIVPGLTGKQNDDGTPAQGGNPGDPIAWGNVVSAKFKAKVVAIAADLQVSPDHLMAAMHFESAGTFSPAVTNSSSCAVGLIQFTGPIARNLGTSPLDLSRTNAVDQLDYVKKYLAPYTGKLNSIEDAYLAILAPAFVGKASDTPVFTKEDNPLEYSQNSGLDKDGDGVITKQEAATPAREHLQQGLKDGNRG